MNTSCESKRKSSITNILQNNSVISNYNGSNEDNVYTNKYTYNPQINHILKKYNLITPNASSQCNTKIMKPIQPLKENIKPEIRYISDEHSKPKLSSYVSNIVDSVNKTFEDASSIKFSSLEIKNNIKSQCSRDLPFSEPIMPQLILIKNVHKDDIHNSLSLNKENSENISEIESPLTSQFIKDKAIIISKNF